MRDPEVPMQPYGPIQEIPPIETQPRARGRAPSLGPIVFVVALAGMVGAALFAHNTMGGRAEAVNAAWAQVESSLQRRADLVPRLVQVVNKAARHEAEVLEGVTAQRVGATLAQALENVEQARRARQARDGAAPSNEAALAALARQDAAVGRGLRAVLAVAESYPMLRASDAYLELQAQLEGTENRINAARMAFNEAVRSYNAALVQLPTSLVAQASGLERRPYFSADRAAHAVGPLALD